LEAAVVGFKEAMFSASGRSSQISSEPVYTYTDRFHTGPGTLAGRFMRMFWLPVYLSEDLLPGTAKPIRIMSEEFTLYRGESGTLHVVAFRCAHRRTQLSVGWVEEDCIRCIYHGWKYEGSGQCVDQPAEANPWADKVKIASYPTREYLGFIFVFFGEGDPPSLPRYSEFEDFEGILKWNLITRECNIWNNLENSLDYCHVGFVHQYTHGLDGLIENPLINAEESQWGITMVLTWRNGKQDISQWGMPSILHTLTASTERDIADYNELLVIKVPIDDERHLQFRLDGLYMLADKNGNNSDSPTKQDTYGSELSQAILRGEAKAEDFDLSLVDLVNLQDDLAQVGQGVIPDCENELLGQTDVGVILVRKLWERELQALAEGRPLKKWTYDRENLPLRDWREALRGPGTS
jgi:5,5'-dehydrodivanillate O-demethylase